MTRRAVTTRLTLIVALAGLLPIALVGLLGIELVRSRTGHQARTSLGEVADQAAARIDSYLRSQKRLLRALAAVAEGPQAEQRLEESVLEAPSLGRVILLGPTTPEDQRPRALAPPLLAEALAGKEVSSSIFLAEDTTPAMLHCVPARALPGQAVCAQLDLLELWRFVQRIHAGDSGYALVFDGDGKLLASGSGRARAAILTGERISSAAHRASPGPYLGAEGEEVIAGWTALPELGWSVAVEQPTREAFGAARTAQWLLAGVLLLALGLSLLVGSRQSAQVLEVLATEERWKTAGRIAAGITHDLGHRLRRLQLTSNLAADGNPAFLPQIKENLASEVAALQKFVADFSDLSRDVKALEKKPLEVGSFLDSVGKTAALQAQPLGIAVEVRRPPTPLWVSADRYLLERALLNLAANAIEASARGTVVELSASAGPAGVSLSVRDRGQGIAPERLQKLFDAFVSTRRTGSHLGMGLANVKRICDAHQAKVAVQSGLGQGSTFTITLAAAEPPPQSSSLPSGELRS